MTTSTTTASFCVDCPQCDVTTKSDDFDEAKLFVKKHNEHTGHTMEWVSADFEYSFDMQIVWKLVCEHCDDEWEFTTGEDAEEFKQEHAQYTDHEIQTNPIMSSVDESELNTVQSAISALSKQNEEGAPIEGVCALLTQNNLKMSSVMSKINELLHRGEVYEPKEGYLRLV